MGPGFRRGDDEKVETSQNLQNIHTLETQRFQIRQ
jgi:hypothetical protein